MKLIYIANARIPTEKAHGIQIMQMCEAFTNAGNEVELVLPQRLNYIKGDPFEYYGVERNFKIKKLPCLDLIPLDRYLGKLSLWIQAISFNFFVFPYLLLKKADIIYTRDKFLLPLCLLKKNIVYEAHDFPKNYFLYLPFLNRLRGMVVISHKLEEFFVKNGIPKNKILVAPDGVDLEKFDIKENQEECRKKLNLPLDKKIVLYTGHLYEWKGATTLAASSVSLDEDTFIIFVGGTKEDIERFKSEILNLKSVLTVHNLSTQGKWNQKEILDFLNLRGNELPTLKLRDKNSDFNALQQGILNADLLNTVSPTYAKKILTKEYGEDLEESLIKRKKELFGILNGIDKKRFNPETDPNLKANYSLKNLEKKIENKIHLQEILNFKKSPETPLLAFIGRLDLQKGIDLIIEVIPELIKLGCQLRILGVGSPDYEKKLLELSQKYPKNISAQIKFDPVLAQKIYAGADIFLMPSKFEPCGLGQMIAMRYGTIPIARQTGGLVDTIDDGKTGFLFKEYQVEVFLKTIKKVLNLYQDKREWQKLMRAAMKKDFSWTLSAKKYLKLYKKLLNV